MDNGSLDPQGRFYQAESKAERLKELIILTISQLDNFTIGSLDPHSIPPLSRSTR